MSNTYNYLQIGQTPLIYAVIEQQVPVIEMLIRSGVDVTYGNKLHNNWAAIHWAALTDDAKVSGTTAIRSLKTMSRLSRPF